MGFTAARPMTRCLLQSCSNLREGSALRRDLHRRALRQPKNVGFLVVQNGGKKTPNQQHLQPERGVRRCEKNNSADTKPMEDDGGADMHPQPVEGPHAGAGAECEESSP
ncbi:hypothetical protein GRJ2_000535800 [Grus japonensis]|uniref:Uncharacterized protein n=1 Tax=Grus japonensis TaxID=30415 RepID=A0ABC9W6K1_GRUJA